MSNGILIFEGMEVGVLPEDLKFFINNCGSESQDIILSTAYNVLPIWLRIAYDNLRQSKIASEKVVNKWSENSILNKQLLVSELEPSLMVFVSCGIALDALYDMFMPHAKFSKSEIEKWREEKCKRETGRARKISEVIRRVYNLDKLVYKQFNSYISEILKFRNWAVHPSVKLQRSCIRKDINVGVDWKFSAFRYQNSELCFKKTINMLIYLYENKCNNAKVVDKIDNIVKQLIELGVLTQRREMGVT